MHSDGGTLVSTNGPGCVNPQRKISRDARLDGNATSDSPPDGASTNDVNCVSANLPRGKILTGDQNNAKETSNYAHFAFVPFEGMGFPEGAEKVSSTSGIISVETRNRSNLPDTTGWKINYGRFDAW